MGRSVDMPNFFNLSFMDSTVFSWVVVPLLIFTARVMDVSMMTMRIIFVSRGRRYLAPAIGFFEVLIWLLAMGQVMKNLNNPASYIAYAAGFATGNMVGMYLEKKLALGMLLVRVITVYVAGELVAELRSAGYGVTSIEAQGATGRAQLIFMVIKRKDLAEVQNIIIKSHPKAFISIEEVQSAGGGVFPPDSPGKSNKLRLLSMKRK
jgi:uncharacterized protein YebE (UPF0316 family)